MHGSFGPLLTGGAALLATGAPISGSASVTLGALTSSAAGRVEVHGVSSSTLDALTASSAGTVAVQGAAAVTLDALTSSAAGTVLVLGASSVTLADLSPSAAGTVLVVGSASIALADASVTAAGGVRMAGAASVTLDALALAGVVEVVFQPIHGAASITLGTLVIEPPPSQVETDYIGRVVQDASDYYAGSVADSGYHGAIAATAYTGGLVADAYVGVVEWRPLPVEGEASITTGAVTAGGAGAVLVQGAGAATLAAATVSGAGVSVPTDGPGAWFVPSQDSHWASLAALNSKISTPLRYYGCQDASSSNLAEVNGGTVLTAHDSPLWQQTVPGWARKFVGTAEASFAGFRHASGVGSNPSTTSVAWLFYMSFATSASHPVTYDWQVGTELHLKQFNNGRIQVSDVNHGAVSGTFNYGGTASVHAYLIVLNRTAQTIRTYTTGEQISGPAWQAIIDGPKGFTSNASYRPDTRCCFIAQWAGAAAEALDKTVLETLTHSAMPY